MGSSLKFRILCSCGKPLEVSRANIGKTGRCPTCKTLFIVPDPDQNKAEQRSDGTTVANNDIPEELDLELDLPSASDLNRSTAFQASFSEAFVSPARVSQYPLSKPRQKSLSLQDAMLPLGILAAIFVIAAVGFAAVVAGKSYLATMPRAVAVMTYGKAIDPQEAKFTATKWLEAAPQITNSPASFDEVTLFTKVLERVVLPPASRAEAIMRMKELLPGLLKLPSTTEFQLEAVSASSDTQEPTVTVRSWNRDTGELEYLVAKCRRSEDLSVRVCDIDRLDGRGWLSEQMKRKLLMTPILKQQILESFVPHGIYADAKTLKKIASICGLPTNSLNTSENPLEELPPEFQVSKELNRNFILTSIEGRAGWSFDQSYKAYIRSFPSDASFALYALRRYAQEGLLLCLEKEIKLLDIATDGDRYLDWYRAIIAVVNNDQPASLALLESLDSQVWAPPLAKSLLKFARNPKERPLNSFPLVGEQIVAMKYLFAKPKTAEEKMRDQNQEMAKYRERDSQRGREMSDIYDKESKATEEENMRNRQAESNRRAAEGRRRSAEDKMKAAELEAENQNRRSQDAQRGRQSAMEGKSKSGLRDLPGNGIRPTRP